MLHDALILAGMVAADALISGRLVVPRAVDWYPPNQVLPRRSRHSTKTPRLHKVLTVICFMLLVGLLVECMAMFPAILVRFGWS